MFGLSLGHLIVLAIVVLLFGSRRLPQLGASMGQTLHAFKNAMEGRETAQIVDKKLEKGESETRTSSS